MYLDSCLWERCFRDENWAEAFWRKILISAVTLFKDKCKDTPASLENQAKPNKTKASFNLKSVFLTTLHNYHLIRSQGMSNMNVKSKNMNVLWQENMLAYTQNHKIALKMI